MQTLYLLYLDRHHLGDDLFLKSLAQHMVRGKSGEPPCVLVHGSGEKVERTLEAQGLFPERTDGVLEVEGDEQRRLVERAVREVNQDIVAALTDEVVSTVGIQGVDRNLLERDADGAIRASSVGWLETLIKQRVVPVVSALVEEEQVEEVWAVHVLEALADALSTAFDPVACVLTTADQPRLPEAEGELEQASLEALPDEHVSEPNAVRRLVEDGRTVLLTTLQGLFGEGAPRGTYLRPAADGKSGETPEA
ncbi:MAG: acetylglutamate kinase [Salinibacter sp.]